MNYLTKTTDYGVYNFYCGSNTKSGVNSLADLATCYTFDGKISNTNGENTFFALRNVKLKSDFKLTLSSD